MINGVVLQRLHQREEIMGFRNKNPVVVQKRENAFDNLMNVFNMGKDVGGGHKRRASRRGHDFLYRIGIEEGNERRHSAFDGEPPGIGGLNAMNSMTGL